MEKEEDLDWGLEDEYFSDEYHVYLVTSLANLRRRKLMQLGNMKTVSKSRPPINKNKI